MPGSLPVDPATLPDAIREELEAPDPVAIDTAATELADGLNRCPKCGSTDIRHKLGTDLLVCVYCRNEWDGARVEDGSLTFAAGSTHLFQVGKRRLARVTIA